MHTSKLSPIFYSRSFAPIAQPGIKLAVDHLAWETLGDCKSGRLVATVTGPLDLDQFSALLRCPVEIYTASGRLAWWGLVWSVRIQDERSGVWLTLDDLANRVRTVYGLLEPEAIGSGLRSATTWSDDLDSQAAYGVKEEQYPLAIASTSQAEAYRDANLDQHHRISPRPVIGQGAPVTKITVHLRGWWDTLSWRYYANTIGLIENLTRDPIHLNNFCTGAAYKVAQSITVSDDNWQIESFWVALRRVNSGSTLHGELCADSGGSPGSVLGSVTMAGGGLSEALTWVQFLLSSPVSVSAGTYWIVVHDNSSLNQYRILTDVNTNYAGGSMKFYTPGGGWFAGSEDLQFRVAGTMQTTEQIKLMAAAAAGGQFLAGIKVDQASGVYTNPRRYGDTTALDEILALLEAGTSTGIRLQARITPERYLAISARPAASAAAWQVRNDGILRLPGGQIAEPGPGMAGTWSVLNTRWATHSASWLQAAGRVFIERVEWSQGVCRVVSPAAT